MAFDDVPTTRRQMTADDVLAVFHGYQRAGFGDLYEQVTSDTGLDEAIPATGLQNDVVWGEDRWLWKTVQKVFRVSIPRDEWKAALRPWCRHTLGDLCELIAPRATVEEIRPVTVLGRPCLPAGAFFAVRSALAGAGINVAGVRPSTPLEPMLKRYRDRFLMPLFMLEPGKLPPLSIEEPLPVTLGYRSILLGLLVLVLAIPAAWLNMPGLVFGLMAAAATVFLGVLTLTVGTLFPPREVKLGELKTFRDLCLALVEPNGGGNDAQE